MHTKTTAQRFWEKVDKSGECWVWTGARQAKGYGHFKESTHSLVKSHRWSYTEAYGPIPEGLTIDHLCRNTSCVRPDHLEAVDNKTNVLRGSNPCAVNARKTHCPRGHEYTPENTYIRPSGNGRACRICWLAQASGPIDEARMANLGTR